jgi:hypothetical protein
MERLRMEAGAPIQRQKQSLHRHPENECTAPVLHPLDQASNVSDNQLTSNVEFFHLQPEMGQSDLPTRQLCKERCPDTPNDDPEQPQPPHEMSTECH